MIFINDFCTISRGSRRPRDSILNVCVSFVDSNADTIETGENNASVSCVPFDNVHITCNAGFSEDLSVILGNRVISTGSGFFTNLTFFVSSFSTPSSVTLTTLKSLVVTIPSFLF